MEAQPAEVFVDQDGARRQKVAPFHPASEIQDLSVRFVGPRTGPLRYSEERLLLMKPLCYLWEGHLEEGFDMDFIDFCAEWWKSLRDTS